MMAPDARSARLRAARRVAALAIIALCVVAIAHATSLLHTIDMGLRATYYRIAAPVESTATVVLVEADERTVQSWGGPPWPGSRKRTLLDRIASGNPRAVVVLDDDRMFAPALGESSPLLEDATLVEIATHLDPGWTSIDELDATDLPLGELGPVFAALGVPLPATGTLPVHFLWPPSKLPTIGAHRIEHGDIPPSTFEGKVVVLGMTSATHRDRVSTPVGALTAPEIVGHALAAVADGRTASPPRWWLRWSGLLGVIVLAATLLHRSPPKQALSRAGLMLAALMLFDFVLFSRGVLAWGISTEIVALVATGIGHGYLVQKRGLDLVEQASDRIAVQLDETSASAAAPPAEFWEDLAELGQAYLGEDATGVVAELPAEAWHLEFRAFVGMDAEAVEERRRDIRRPPYREAYLTLRAHVAERPFVRDADRKTLVVPLTDRGRLYGVWLVNLAGDVPLSAADQVSIEELGAEMGRAIAGHRHDREERGPLHFPSGANLEEGIDIVMRGIEALGEDKRQVSGLFDSLPLGLLVADVWGHVERVNNSMRDRLAVDFPDGIPGDDLRAVLARTTGSSLTEVHAMMRRVVRTGDMCRLQSRRDVDAQVTGRASFVLMRLRQPADPGSFSPTDTGTTHLVLLSRPETDDATNTMFYAG